MVKLVFPISRLYAEVDKALAQSVAPDRAIYQAIQSLGEEYLMQAEEIALIGWPLGSGTVSGKFRNQIFQTRNGKTYIKRYTIPYDPKSAKQLAQRNLVRACAASWNAMPEPEKNLWREKAKESEYLNGYTCYFKTVCQSQR